MMRPLIGSVSLFLTVGGAAMWLNHSHAGPWVMTVGFLILLAGIPACRYWQRKNAREAP